MNKKEEIDWQDLKHIIISFINEYYSDGNDSVIDKSQEQKNNKELNDIERKIIVSNDPFPNSVIKNFLPISFLNL